MAREGDGLKESQAGEKLHMVGEALKRESHREGVDELLLEQGVQAWGGGSESRHDQASANEKTARCVDSR